MAIGSARHAVVRFATRADLMRTMDYLKTLFSSVVSVRDDVSDLFRSISAC